MKKMKKALISLVILIIFNISIYAQYTKLLDFNLINGGYPDGSFISDGTFLYGMTLFGGANNLAELFLK